MTTAIQDFLRGGGDPASLGINAYRHPTLPLVGYKYSQTASPKRHEVVRDARGIVLEADTHTVVAKPFRRFFNAGEDPEADARFDWSDCTVTTKHDGSLCILYHYAGEWHVNTSGSFGLLPCGHSGRSWREVFWRASGLDRSRLRTDSTYIFELCTPWNKVVRSYPEPTVYLISAFFLPALTEFHPATVQREALILDVPHVGFYDFRSLAEVRDYLDGLAKTDPTFEGVVIRDRRGERLKVKSRTYVEMHRLLDNGNVYHPRRLAPLVLSGEADEVAAVMPEVRSALAEVRAEIDAAFAELAAVWESVRGIESQRDFAREVLARTPFSGVLFQVRKMHADWGTIEDLRAQWRLSGDRILKVLYGDAPDPAPAMAEAEA